MDRVRITHSADGGFAEGLTLPEGYAKLRVFLREAAARSHGFLKPKMGPPTRREGAIGVPHATCRPALLLAVSVLAAGNRR